MAVPATDYKLIVKFSLDGIDRSVHPIGLGALTMPPEGGNELCLLRVALRKDSEPKVCGLGMPFANPGHPSDGWVNHGEPIVGNHTLLDTLSRRNFYFVVPSSAKEVYESWAPERVRPPFCYYYGTEHHWDLERYRKMAFKLKGRPFAITWNYHDNNEYLTAMTQSQVQDIFWLTDASRRIFDTRLRAYFVPTDNLPPAHININFYAIVPLDQPFLKEHAAALRCIINDDTLRLNIHASDHDKMPVEWMAQVVDSSDTIEALENHHLDDYDLVLAVRQGRPSWKNIKLKTFNSRVIANAALEVNKDN
ncbi:hypothetical protein V8C42DRAFT_346827 [Trichoderma barbatum]